jgi:uncharacterized cupredoxin-like copper-binding protein
MVGLGFPLAAQAHDQHASFSAGEPGDPKKPARVVNVSMQEEGKKMLFDPALITVRKGEQIRFILFNKGTESHEFVLATIEENRKHAELMKKFPEMEHADPNARRVGVFDETALVRADLVTRAAADLGQPTSRIDVAGLSEGECYHCCSDHGSRVIVASDPP